MNANSFGRIGLVVHPRRELGNALQTVREWAERQGSQVVQVRSPGHIQEVAPAGEIGVCDFVIALGGDGTTLAALRAAAPVRRPVLGVACGSLGALTAVTADRLRDALDHVARGEYDERRLPALIAETADGELAALNDLVLVRDGAGQVMFEVEVDGERFIRLAGDGVVAATPLGSSAYTLAAGGPLLAGGAAGLAVTPLAPHGGACPPLVTGPESRVAIKLESGNGGARVELDGQIHSQLEPRVEARFALRLEPGFAALVSLGEEETPIAGLRRRRILMDSPRVLARDDRAAQADGRSQPPSDSSSRRQRHQRPLRAARPDQLNADREAARLGAHDRHADRGQPERARVGGERELAARVGRHAVDLRRPRAAQRRRDLGRRRAQRDGVLGEPRVGLVLAARERRRGLEVGAPVRLEVAGGREHLLQVGRQLGPALADHRRAARSPSPSRA